MVRLGHLSGVRVKPRALRNSASSSISRCSVPGRKSSAHSSMPPTIARLLMSCAAASATRDHQVSRGSCAGRQARQLSQPQRRSYRGLFTVVWLEPDRLHHVGASVQPFALQLRVVCDDASVFAGTGKPGTTPAVVHDIRAPCRMEPANGRARCVSRHSVTRADEPRRRRLVPGLNNTLALRRGPGRLQTEDAWPADS